MTARCAASERCADYDRQAELPALAAADARLCEPCLRLAARDVRALVWDYRDLAQRIAAGGGAASTRSAPGPRIPIDLGVDALQRDIAHTLTVWEPPVREAAGLSPETTRGVRPGWAVATAVAVIAPRVALMSTLPASWCFQEGPEAPPALWDGLGGLEALRGLHWRARYALGVTRLVQRLPGECSACGLEALRRADGSDTVHCAGCGRRWTYDDYRRYVGLMLGALGA